MNLVDWYNTASTILLHNISSAQIPFKYFLVVTKSCGSKCTNCLIWKEIPENEMTLEEYERLAINSRNNLVWLNISGGEPTDRNDLVDIIKLFVKHCPNLKIINFTTNGLNYEKLREVCLFLDSLPILIKGLNVSIDGPPDLHDRLRGTKNGFIQAIEALKLVRNFRSIKSAAGMTLFPANHEQIQDTLLAISEHIPDFTIKDLHLNFPHSSSHYYGNERISYQERIKIEKVRPYFKNTFSSFSPFEIVESIYQSHLLEFVKTGRTPMTCAAIKSNIYISEKGDIYPCTIWDKKIGSLREHNFDLKSLLQSDLVRSTRNQIVNKNCPNCWTPCEAFPSIVTNLKKLPFTPL